MRGIFKNDIKEQTMIFMYNKSIQVITNIPNKTITTLRDGNVVDKIEYDENYTVPQLFRYLTRIEIELNIK